MSEASDAVLLEKVVWLRKNIQAYDDPEMLSKLAGMELISLEDEDYLFFKFFNENIKLSYPEIVAYSHINHKPMNTLIQASICYYLHTIITSKYSKIDGEWVSFSELEDGRFYNQAFQGYSGDTLAKHANKIISKSDEIISELKAENLSFGDLAFSVQVFPRVPMALVIWMGDEDFPSSCKILFDRSVNAFLPTDACAILGSMFTQRIIKLVK